jgi:hypothetical protein
VADFIGGPSPEVMVKPDKALINGINYHVQCCQRLLCQFTVNIFTFDDISFDPLQDRAAAD